MSFTISFPFLYHLIGGNGGFNIWSGGNVSEGGNLTHTKAKFREGGCLITGVNRRRRERKVDNRRVSIAGEQFLCGGRAVSYQRAEEAERKKNSILFDKVATFPICFKFVPNRRGGELHF